MRIGAFTGMNNVTGGGMVADGVIAPKILLNCYPDNQGKLIKNPGYASVEAITSGRDLFGGRKVLLWIAGGTATLYRVKTGGAVGSPVTITPAIGTTKPMKYCEIGDTVYMSSTDKTWVLEDDETELRPWGQAAPTGDLDATTELESSSGAGNLPPGVYKLCATKVAASGRPVSSIGQVKVIIAEQPLASITPSGLIAGEAIWMTEPNGSVFYYVGEHGEPHVTTIATPPKSKTSLPSLMFLNVVPYLGTANIIHFAGRIIGAHGSEVHFSEPFLYECFGVGKFIDFGVNITVIAAVKDGLFVSSVDRTWFGAGRDPMQMEWREVGKGAVPGSLPTQSGSFHEESGQQIDTWKSAHLSPTWVDSEGHLVQGTQHGRIIKLTPGVKMDAGASAASLWRRINGMGQYVTSSPIPSAVHADSETSTALTNGYLIGD